MKENFFVEDVEDTDKVEEKGIKMEKDKNEN